MSVSHFYFLLTRFRAHSSSGRIQVAKHLQQSSYLRSRSYRVKLVYRGYVNQPTLHLHADVYLITGVYQQTTSGLSITAQDCYELVKGCFSIFGFEYIPGWECRCHITIYVLLTGSRFDNAYITWINNGKPVWTVKAAGMGPDTQTKVCIYILYVLQL